jgi:hypothetical protein
MKWVLLLMLFFVAFILLWPIWSRSRWSSICIWKFGLTFCYYIKWFLLEYKWWFFIRPTIILEFFYYLWRIFNLAWSQLFQVIIKGWTVIVKAFVIRLFNFTYTRTPLLIIRLLVTPFKYFTSFELSLLILLPVIFNESN